MDKRLKNILLLFAGIGIVAFTTVLVFFLFHYFKFYYSEFSIYKCSYKIYLGYAFNVHDYLRKVFNTNLFIVYTNIIAFTDIIIFYILLRIKQYQIARGIVFSILAMIITFVLIRFL